LKDFEFFKYVKLRRHFVELCPKALREKLTTRYLHFKFFMAVKITKEFKATVLVSANHLHPSTSFGGKASLTKWIFKC